MKLAAVLLVAPPPDDQVSPGLLGFAVVFGLALATVLLIRSMVYHLRKVRYSPDPAASRPADPGAHPDPAASRPADPGAHPDPAASRPDGSAPADEPGTQDGSTGNPPDDRTGGPSSGV